MTVEYMGCEGPCDCLEGDPEAPDSAAEQARLWETVVDQGVGVEMES